MTERRIHYHRGGVTARLELVMPDGGELPEAFTRRHAEAVEEAFSGVISERADEAFEAARARDCAYRFRPFTLRVEYALADAPASKRANRARKRKKPRRVTLFVSYTCTSGRLVAYRGGERHIFRLSGGEYLYLGQN